MFLIKMISTSVSLRLLRGANVDECLSNLIQHKYNTTQCNDCNWGCQNRWWK